MKKILTVLMFMATMALAGDEGYFKELTASYPSGVVSNVTPTYTNELGERLLIKGLWLSSPVLTNGTVKFANSTAITNDLPMTLTWTTLYYTPGNDGLILEPAGRLPISALMSASNSTVRLTIQATRPK